MVATTFSRKYIEYVVNETGHGWDAMGWYVGKKVGEGEGEGERGVCGDRVCVRACVRCAVEVVRTSLLSWYARELREREGPY